MERIAIVQGAETTAIDDLLAGLVDRWSPSIRIAGILAEPHGIPTRTCRAGLLRCIASSKRFSLFDEAGEVAEHCHLDGRGALAAAEAEEPYIAAGRDLVILNKFAKMEEAGEGLCRAFTAALRGGTPLLSAVSPARMDSFRAYVGDDVTVLPPDAAAVDAWIEAIRHGVRAI